MIIRRTINNITVNDAQYENATSPNELVLNNRYASNPNKNGINEDKSHRTLVLSSGFESIWSEQKPAAW